MQADAAQVPLDRRTVLLVEDDENIRLLARLALDIRGYAVLAAANGDQALEIARHHLGDIHVLLTDIQVPGMRGPDLAARIASLRPGIKVLFMSGAPDDAAAGREGLPAGAALLGKQRLTGAAPPVPEQAVADVKADVEEIRERTHR